MFQRQAAARTDLHFIPGRNLKRQASGNGAGKVRLEHNRFDAPDIHAGVFGRSVSILWQVGVLVKFLDTNVHDESAIIAR
jgi:hypothetical protein